MCKKILVLYFYYFYSDKKDQQYCKITKRLNIIMEKYDACYFRLTDG